MTSRVTERWYVETQGGMRVLMVEDQRGQVAAVAYLLPGKRSKDRERTLVNAAKAHALAREGLELMGDLEPGPMEREDGPVRRGAWALQVKALLAGSKRGKR